jgi:pimeloyl-ACP methyl ester carboxylesterase
VKGIVIHDKFFDLYICFNFGCLSHKTGEKFRVIYIDLPGHGLSDIYGEVHTMEFMATAMKELIDSQDLKKVFLTGHSLDG